MVKKKMTGGSHWANVVSEVDVSSLKTITQFIGDFLPISEYVEISIILA